MAEIKTKIERMVGENTGRVSYLITEDHTIADIARWIIEENYTEEIMMFLNSPDEFL